MITFTQKGDLSAISNYLKNTKKKLNLSCLDAYGKRGVEALSIATPFDTGLTSKSWYYKIEKKDHNISLIFCNSNIQNGIPIAIILQYGHGTRNGGYVQGTDYINPALSPVFERLAKEAWAEVSGK